jgi:hypothetical protein
MVPQWLYDQFSEKAQRMADLEAENAALWAFVRAADAWHDIDDPIETNQEVLRTRDALRQYEEKP